MNNKPLGDFKSANILPMRKTSVAESKGVFRPPRNKKSGDELKDEILSGIGDLIYGCPLLPPPILSLPNFRDLRSVFKSINGIT